MCRLNRTGLSLVVVHEYTELLKGTTLAYPNQSAYQPVYVMSRPTNGMAIAAFVMVFVFFPIGIVLGHVARGQIKRTGEGGKGLATAALILGYLQVAVIVGIVGVAVILVAAGAQ